MLSYLLDFLVFAFVNIEEVLALAVEGGLLPALDLLVSVVGCPLELELQVSLLDFLLGECVPGLGVQNDGENCSPYRRKQT